MTAFKNWFKGFLKSLILILLVVALISILTKGFPLVGIPNEKDIEKVAIYYPEVKEEPKYFTDERNIELASALPNFLKYVPFKAPSEDNNEMITITYYLKDGSVKEVSANNQNVFYNGKTHLLNDDETFINLAEGIFFLAEVAPAL